MVAFLFLAALASAEVGSRPPNPKCVWHKLASADGGFEFLHEKCDLGYRTVDFVQKGAGFYEVLHDTDGAHPDSSTEVLAVYSKDPAETPEAAIKRQFLPELDDYKKKHCVVVPVKLDFLKAGEKAYTLNADKAYEKKQAAATPEGDIPEPPCGEHGYSADGSSYIEFHPGEDPGKFVYVDFGQEEHPDFDETSLRFIPPKKP